MATRKEPGRKTDRNSALVKAKTDGATARQLMTRFGINRARVYQILKAEKERKT